MSTSLTYGLSAPQPPMPSVPVAGSATCRVRGGMEVAYMEAKEGLTANSFTYTFSAKEKDSETGLSYFGSRYYSSDLSIWLSVDPMSDKYPSLSPYVSYAEKS